MNIKDQLHHAQLQEAIKTATAAVRTAPQNIQQRQLLCELLTISGDLERADKQWDAVLAQAPQSAISVLPLRQLIRAEQTRVQCFQQGGVPDSFQELTDAQKYTLQAMIEIRQGDLIKAQTFLAQAQAAQPIVSGTYNGREFTGMRDCDDLCAGSIEALTTQGKYYWIPFEHIATLTLHAPEQPLDLIWRQASLTMHNGLTGEIYLPAIYIHTPCENEAARLGHVTEWQSAQNHPVTGIGQRLFLFGDISVPIMELESLILQETRAA
jgi:type VI secretion system protein ImpE